MNLAIAAQRAEAWEGAALLPKGFMKVNTTIASEEHERGAGAGEEKLAGAKIGLVPTSPFATCRRE